MKNIGRPARTDGRNARTVASNKYNDKNYERINLTVKKGNKEKIQAAATAAGESVNGYINKLLANNIPNYDLMTGGPAEGPEGSQKTDDD